MAVHLFYGRILSASLAIIFAVSLAVTFDAAAPAQAGHFLTHPAGTPAAPSAPSLAAQTRAPNATAASSRAATLFKKGADINIKRDANVYITPRNIPGNDRRLERYNADRPNGGRAQAKAGEAAAVPGLLGIANEAHRGRDPDGRNNQAYSLADAMRDAIWRRDTAAKLRSLTTSMSACAKGVVKRTPSIGLGASC